MVLVDTSVWIDVLHRPARVTLEELVAFDEVAPCPPVVHEVLQGIAGDVAWRGVREAMLALPVVESASAIRHGLTVLHHDRDYPAIARISELQQRQVAVRR